jgi:outer membrane protein assembly factor BamB
VAVPAAIEIVQPGPGPLHLSALGAQAAFVARVLDASGQPIPDASVRWTTSNSLVVALTPTTGIQVAATAVGNGEAVVRAAIGNHEAQRQVVVQQRVSQLGIEPDSLALDEGGTGSLTALPRDANGHLVSGAPVRWRSEHPATARVTGTGLQATVEGVAAGSTRVLAEIEGGTATAAVPLVVRGVAAGSLKWQRALGGSPIRTTPAISADGATLYVTSDDGRLWALATGTGEVRWSFATGGRIRGAPAIASDGDVVVASADGKLYKVRPQGSQRWAVTLGAEIPASPAIDAAGRIFAVTTRDTLYAVASTGGILWRQRLGIQDCDALVAPTIGLDGSVLVPWCPRVLRAFDPANGSARWTTELTTWWSNWRADGVSAAIAADGTILLGTTVLTAVSMTGQVRWSNNIGARTVCVIAADGSIVLAGYNSVASVNPSGTTRWVTEWNVVRGPLGTAAVAANGTIFIGGSDGGWSNSPGSLYALDPVTGVPIWRFATPDGLLGGATIGPDGVVYVGSDKGVLYAVHGKAGPLAPNAWPTHRGNLANTGRDGTR